MDQWNQLNEINKNDQISVGNFTSQREFSKKDSSEKKESQEEDDEAVCGFVA